MPKDKTKRTTPTIVWDPRSQPVDFDLAALRGGVEDALDHRPPGEVWHLKHLPKDGDASVALVRFRLGGVDAPRIRPDLEIDSDKVRRFVESDATTQAPTVREVVCDEARDYLRERGY